MPVNATVVEFIFKLGEKNKLSLIDLRGTSTTREV